MKKSKMLLALLVLSTAGVLASCVKPSTSSSAPAPSTSSAPAPSTSSSAPAPSTSSSSVAPSTSSSAPAPSTSSSSPVVATPSFEVPTYIEYENVSNWENGSVEANKVFGNEYMTIVPRDDKAWTIEDHEKTAEDGTKFTKRIKSNGQTKSNGGYIYFETEGATKLVFYAISSSSSKTRPLTVVKDWASVSANLPEEGIIKEFAVVGDKVGRYEVELPEAGSYVLHLGEDEENKGGINFYQFELIDTAAGNQKIEIASLKVVGPDEYRVGGEFDPSKYSVYGLSADGKYEHLLEESEYTLGTIDTTVEKVGENALDLEAKYVGFESIKGACEIEVWNWYGINVADDLKALFVVSEGATEFKNGSDIKFTANNPGNILKSVTLTVGGQPKDVTIEDGEFTVEGANGDINLTAATWESEVVDGNVTKIEWDAATALTDNWAALKSVKIEDGTKFGDFTYNVVKDSSESKYSNKDVPSIQLGSQGKATLSFATTGKAKITVVACATGNGKDVKVALYKADGTLVAEGPQITDQTETTVTLDIPEAGNYYIAASAKDHLRVFSVSCEVEAPAVELTDIEWDAATALTDNWAALKSIKIEDGTKFGDFTYNVVKDSSESKYSNKDVPSIQLGSQGKATLSFATNGASTVTVVACATGNGKDVKVALYKADGTLVAEGPQITDQTETTVTLDIPEAGEYYIAASAKDHLRVFSVSCEQTA